MKAIILCWIIWIVGFVGGAIAITLKSFWAGFFAGFVGGILLYEVAKYFEGRMKCKNS